MSYIGSSATPLPVAFSGVRTQSFNGTGSQTAFTLSRAVSAVTDIEVVVNNVQQSPYDSSYNISGATLTFSEAPSSGTNNIYVIFRDQPLGSLTDTTAVKLTGDQTITGTKTFSGTVVIGRVDSSSEGGQLDLCRSTDNAPAWGIDVNGNTSTPSLRFVDNIAAASRMQIDSGGRVTMPNQATLGISTMVGSLGNAFTGGTVHVNKGGFSYNSGTGTVTFPATGTYLISYGAFTNANNSNLVLTIQINGAGATYEAFACSNGVSSLATATQTVIRNIAAGDSLKMYSGGGSVYSSGWGNFLSIVLIG